MGVQDREYTRPPAAPRRFSNSVMVWGLAVAVSALSVVVLQQDPRWTAWRQKLDTLISDLMKRTAPPPNLGPLPQPGSSASPSISSPPSSRVHEVFRCVRDGAVTYSDDQTCGKGRASVVLADPDANILKSIPVSPARVQPQPERPAPARGFATSASITRSTAQGSADDAMPGECSLLAQRILLLDQRARQPLSGWEQDQIRVERTRTRDRQNTLKC